MGRSCLVYIAFGTNSFGLYYVGGVRPRIDNYSDMPFCSVDYCTFKDESGTCYRCPMHGRIDQQTAKPCVSFSGRLHVELFVDYDSYARSRETGERFFRRLNEKVAGLEVTEEDLAVFVLEALGEVYGPEVVGNLKRGDV